MQALLELAPLLAFFVTYYIAGLYTATAVLMIGMLAVLAVAYLRERRVRPMLALSTVLVFAFGSATLLFHNKHFIQLKPTVFFWLASLAFLGSFWIGKRTLTERLLGAALGEQGRVEDSVWRWLNVSWVIFYAVLGGLNLLIAYYAPEHVWVNFKLALMIFVFIFAAAQIMWLVRRSEATQPG